MPFKTGFKPFQSQSSQFVFVRHVQAPDQNAKYFFFFLHEYCTLNRCTNCQFKSSTIKTPVIPGSSYNGQISYGLREIQKENNFADKTSPNKMTLYGSLSYQQIWQIFLYFYAQSNRQIVFTSFNTLYQLCLKNTINK